jgi:hypothetical protein
LNDRQQLEAAIAALEAQRQLVGDAVTDAAPQYSFLADAMDSEKKGVTVMQEVTTARRVRARCSVLGDFRDMTGSLASTVAVGRPVRTVQKIVVTLTIEST